MQISSEEIEAIEPTLYLIISYRAVVEPLTHVVVVWMFVVSEKVTAFWHYCLNKGPATVRSPDATSFGVERGAVMLEWLMHR